MRGYALIFVLMISAALGVVIAGLFDVLNDANQSGRAAHKELQQLYGCDGALRLALAEAERHAGDSGTDALQTALDGLAAALPADIDPASGRPFADIGAIRLVPPASTEARIASTAPFVDMEYIEEGVDIEITPSADRGEGRVCRGAAPNKLRTMSYFQFMASSQDVVGSPLSLTVDAGTDGDVFVLQHFNGMGRSGGLVDISDVGDLDFHVVNLTEANTFRLASPSGMPWIFQRKVWKLFRVRRDIRTRRPTFEFFTKYSTDNPTADPVASRFVKGADIRIIDGEWFVQRTGVAFPGHRIFADNDRSSRSHSVLFSSYETTSASGRGGGVIRYGLVDADNDHAVVRGYCTDANELAPIDSDGTVNCVSGTPVVPPTLDPYMAAAKTGFVDPGDGDTFILPIVVDVRQLIAAMNAPATGDIGGFKCLGTSAACPEAAHFQGSVWIGTREGHSVPDGTSRMPCPLEATSDCTRPNAVVLYHLDDLRAFTGPNGSNGLSISSNLPIYVVGDVNDTPTSAGLIDARVALLAPQITVLSSTFDMAQHAWGAPTPTTPVSETLTWHTSLFTGWPSDSPSQRNPATQLLRQIEGDDVHINLTGSVAALFTRRHYLQLSPFERGRGGYSGSAGAYGTDPDVQTQDLPIFLPDDADEISTRLVSGTVRYPGDLRFTKKDRQPPNAPRLSIDPAPLDRR